MAEQLISNRVFFPKGKQRQFLLKVKKILGLTDKELADECWRNIRTITDWKREKNSMPLDTLKTLSQKCGLSIPHPIKIKDPYWYTSTGSSAGGLAVIKKYGRIGGDEISRKKKWYEWWNSKGRFQKHPIINISKPIKKPDFSDCLAELVGIILGDGGISKYQVVITYHRFDDAAYSKFVRGLITKLFNVPIGTYLSPRALANDLMVSRKELVDFLVEKVGLKIGNKVRQQVDVPDWIKLNSQYKISCLRGLMDTDGCVIRHKYKVGGKEFEYRKLAFSNASKPLIKFVYNVLLEHNMHPRITKDGRGVRVESKAGIKQYFLKIGSSNPKHLNRLKN